jgi:hypothetical protein
LSTGYCHELIDIENTDGQFIANVCTPAACLH